MDSPSQFSRYLRRWFWLPLVLLAFVVGFISRGGSSSRLEHVAHGNASLAADAKPEAWTCSMHPQIILPSNDQQCPICFMDLIPVESGGGPELGPTELSLSEAAVALAEIQTMPVERRLVNRLLKLTGKVAVAENNLRSVTTRFGGRLDRLYVAVTGQRVTEGMKLADIYSPELYMAQAELLAASAKTGDEAASDPALIQAVGERLRLWGMTQRQIDAISTSGRITEHLSVTAPSSGIVVERYATEGSYVKTGTPLYTIADLSSVWIEFDALEYDAALIRPGQSVDFTARALPGRRFSGEVLFIEPVLREATRSVEVRVEVDNQDGLLKPGMLVSGAIQVIIGEGGDPMDADDSVAPLVIPASAPLLTGDRAVVYVRKPGAGDPVFTGVQVELGPRAGDFYVVRSGLNEGDEVVVRGNFKIDSALQIQGRPSMMNPSGAAASATGHDHGHGATAGNDGAVADRYAVATTGLPAPDCFRERLGKAFDRYLSLQAALAGDDLTAAGRSAADLQEQLSNIACGSEHLPPNSAAVWVDLHSQMAAALGGMQGAAELAGYRASFERLSDNMWQALGAFTEADQTPARRFYCPMAADGAGAHWLQLEKTVANPYYGASMLRCGQEVAARVGEQS